MAHPPRKTKALQGDAFNQALTAKIVATREPAIASDHLERRCAFDDGPVTDRTTEHLGLRPGPRLDNEPSLRDEGHFALSEVKRNATT